MKLGQEVEKEKEYPRHREAIYLLLDLVSPLPKQTSLPLTHPSPPLPSLPSPSLPSPSLPFPPLPFPLLPSPSLSSPPFLSAAAGAHVPLPDHGPVGALFPIRTSQGLLQPGLPQAGAWGRGGEGRRGDACPCRTSKQHWGAISSVMQPFKCVSVWPSCVGVVVHHMCLAIAPLDSSTLACWSVRGTPGRLSQEEEECGQWHT